MTHSHHQRGQEAACRDQLGSTRVETSAPTLIQFKLLYRKLESSIHFIWRYHFFTTISKQCHLFVLSNFTTKSFCVVWSSLQVGKGHECNCPQTKWTHKKHQKFHANSKQSEYTNEVCHLAVGGINATWLPPLSSRTVCELHCLAVFMTVLIFSSTWTELSCFTSGLSHCVFRLVVHLTRSYESTFVESFNVNLELGLKFCRWLLFNR